MGKQSQAQHTRAQELIELLQKQISIENKAIDLLQKTVKRSKNTALKLFLGTIQTDAIKHKQICEAVMALLSGTEISEVERDEMINVTEHHLNLETDAIRNIGEAIKKTDDRNVKALLKLIELDENKHHASLKSLINQLETLEEKAKPKLTFRDALRIYVPSRK